MFASSFNLRKMFTVEMRTGGVRARREDGMCAAAPARQGACALCPEPCTLSPEPCPLTDTTLIYPAY